MPEPMIVQPVTLAGRLVRLEPMTEAHVLALVEASQDDPSIWSYMRYGDLSNPQRMLAWVRGLLRAQDEGTDLPFVAVHLSSGKVAGATRYLEIRPWHRGLEIGGTWYGPEFQRTGVNTECKYLLLGHAFETLQAVRVQFKADTRNERSQRAIERLGAMPEGILRNHMIMDDGYLRDSAYYSIIAAEWPAVKSHLEDLMRKY